MKIKEIIYTAAVIQYETLGYDPIEERFFTHPIRYAHHCTIQFGNVEVIPEFVGKEVNFIANNFFNDNNASAFDGHIDDVEIQELMKNNKQHAHITLSCESGIKPVYSNTLVRVTKPVEKINGLVIPCKIGVYCSFYEGKPDWIF